MGSDPTHVAVPVDLARRIRLALDHAHRDTHPLDENGETTANKLATELVACEGYPLDKEPWSD